MEFSKYTTKNTEEVFRELKTSEKGLNEKEARERLEKYGFNELKGKELNVLEVLFRQFKSPFFYLLFVAALVALFVGEKIDAIAILAFIFVNVILGFFQEFRAEKAIYLLKKYIPLKVRVLRGGKEKTVDKKDLVPGDIVFLETGDIAPADLRVMRLENFLVDESILTGESVPVLKKIEPSLEEKTEIFKAENIVFGGTTIISGKAQSIVIATGRKAVLGEITKLVAEIKRESAYEKNLFYFTRLILRIVVVTITLLFLANLLLRGTTNFFEFLLFCIALIVSILPEALPAVVTFALSQGALRMAKEKVVVRRLSAVEDLGNIEVLCVDKTGTLTKNKLSLEKIVSSDREKCLLYGLLASSYMEEQIESSLNPYDLALFEKATDDIRELTKKFKVISEIAFDPNRMRNGILMENEKGERFLITKGAPEKIIKLSLNFEGELKKEEVVKEIEKETAEGKRVLGIAFKKINKNYFSESDEKDLTFLGCFYFEDPLKETAEEAIKLAEKLGIQIKIITGDSKGVAGFVAQNMGLIDDPQKVVLGEELDVLPEDEFDRACDNFIVFARVSPQTKYKIIQSLQKKYEVGFMGEGINDAPALKMANVGIVVPGAADVSREVSDVVLLQNDLRVVVNGIKNGRMVFSNINKYIKCALASNFGNFYSIAVISLFINFLPMLPVQILLGNLLSDFPLISIATDRIDVEELKRPKLYQIQRMIYLVISLALVSTIFDFIFFAIFFNVQPAVMQTLWYIESILTEIVLIFVVRTRHLFFKTKRPSVPLLVFTILDAFLIVWLPFSRFGQEAFHFIAPPLSGLFIVLFLVLNYFIISEIVKLIYFRHWQKSQPLATSQLVIKN